MYTHTQLLWHRRPKNKDRCSYLRSYFPFRYLIVISAWLLVIKLGFFPPIWNGLQPCCKSRKWLPILINLSNCKMAMHRCTIAHLQLMSDDCSYTMGQTVRYPSVLLLAVIEVTLVHIHTWLCFIKKWPHGNVLAHRKKKCPLPESHGWNVGVYAGVSMPHSSIPARGGGENVGGQICKDCCCFF